MPFEGLRERLLAGGVAPRHVRRYLAELSDHLDDLVQAQHAAGHDAENATARARALLGEEDELAAAMLARPLFRSLAARAPWLVFGLLPPLAVTALFMAMVLVLVGKGAGAIAFHGHHQAPQWFRDLSSAVAILGNFTVGPLLAALMVLIAQRQRIAAFWPLIGATLVASFGMHMQAGAMLLHHRHGFAIGVGPIVPVPHPLGHALSASMPFLLAQGALTLLPVAWLFLGRRGPDRDKPLC